MADQEQDTDTEPQDRKTGIFTAVRKKLGTFSRSSSKQSDKSTSSQEAAKRSRAASQGTSALPFFGSPEQLKFVPKTPGADPDLSNPKFYGSPLPLESIARCPAGFFHNEGGCAGKCYIDYKSSPSVRTREDTAQSRRARQAESSKNPPAPHTHPFGRGLESRRTKQADSTRNPTARFGYENSPSLHTLAESPERRPVVRRLNLESPQRQGPSSSQKNRDPSTPFSHHNTPRAQKQSLAESSRDAPAPVSYPPPASSALNRAVSTASVDIHQVGSAASLRRGSSAGLQRSNTGRRATNPSREASIIFPFLVRTPSDPQFDANTAEDIFSWRAQIDKTLALANMASRPESMMVQGGPREYKRRAIQEAREAQTAIDRWFEHNQSSYKNKYEFRELIGKGSYGRVYKSIQKSTGSTVAIKVLSPDDSDITVPAEARDINLQDAIKEVNILERLKQSGAVNVNGFVEAFSIHSQLWLVSDYCSGGSLTTLRRAVNNTLEEKYIKIIARELAKGLASVHRAGVVHRDIKCANVMVSESGSLNIIDFGVSNVLQSSSEEDKRKTIIGTPHWMAPEIQLAPDKEAPHGAEVDVWAYGVTLYECAIGAPPNTSINPGQMNRLRAMTRQQPPRLPDNGKFSPDLRDLIALCCTVNPKERPGMKEVCEHHYVAGTESEYPTESLQSLVEIYYNWERSGGARQSLFSAGGAQPFAANIPGAPPVPGLDEWVFSTTSDFDRMHGETDDTSFDLLSSSPPREADEWDEEGAALGTLRPSGQIGGPGSSVATTTEHGAGPLRAPSHLAGLFAHPDDDPPPSDLPLRSGDGLTTHRKELSVSSTDDGTPQINLDRIDEKKAKKRETMAWKWNDNIQTQDDAPAPLPARPTLQHANTFAMGQSGPDEASDRQNALWTRDGPARPETLDLDALLGGGGSSAAPSGEYSDQDAPWMRDGPARPETLDMDALLAGGAPTPATHSREPSNQDALWTRGGPARPETLDIDALMSGAAAAAPVPSAAPPSFRESSYAATMSGPRPEASNVRDTLDLDALMGASTSDFGVGPSLGPGFSYGGSNSDSNATMRPASQYHQQHFTQRVEGHDFAQQQPPAPHSLTAQPASHQARANPLDIEGLLDIDIEEMMAGMHDPPMDPASADHESARGYHPLHRSTATLDLASSPPGSPFGSALPRLPAVPDYPLPINPNALRDDAAPEFVHSELRRLLATFADTLDVNMAYLTEASSQAGPASQKVSQGQSVAQNGHSRATSVASSVRDEEGTEGDLEDE